MSKLESLFKSSPVGLPAKTVVVTSAENQSGKTSLIEIIVGKKLDWSELELCPEFFFNEKFKYASVECFGHIINIIEMPKISYNRPYPKEITDLIVNADLVAELHCLNTVFEPYGLPELFEQEVDNQRISSIIENKKVFVFTKAENPDQLEQWWNSLSEEEKAKRNEWNAVNGNPHYSTYFEAVLFERAICMGLYPYDCPEENMFETSILTMQGIDALAAKCKEILFD